MKEFITPKSISPCLGRYRFGRFGKGSNGSNFYFVSSFKRDFSNQEQANYMLEANTVEMLLQVQKTHYGCLKTPVSGSESTREGFEVY